MPFAVQLDLDASLRRQVATLANDLFPDPSVETIHRLGGVPHLTLGVYDSPSLDSFLPEVIAFAQTLEIQPLTLSSWGIFPGKQSVLFLHPVVTESLLAIHRQFHASLNRLELQCWDDYRPVFWVPHVTLAMNLDPGSFSTAFQRVSEGWKGLTGRLDVLRVIRFRPVETLHLQALRDIMPSAQT